MPVTKITDFKPSEIAEFLASVSKAGAAAFDGVPPDVIAAAAKALQGAKGKAAP